MSALATVYYEYPVNGEKYGTWYSRPFILLRSAKNYAALVAKGTSFEVRVKPGGPSVAIPVNWI